MAEEKTWVAADAGQCQDAREKISAYLLVLINS